MKKLLCLTVIYVLTFSGVCFAEITDKEYKKAKIELIFALKDSEINFDPRKPKIMVALDSLDTTTPGAEDNDKDQKLIHNKCRDFFKLANSFSEKTLYAQCKRWGWLQKTVGTF